ncbi:xRE family transcriptional regulator [Acinetobacter sp. 1564232]|nr:xRE family transcriptional regulator [Acinetobacter sp. 1564232]
MTSIKEAGAIKRNEVQASRVTELTLPDIKEVREKTAKLNLLHVCILARTLQTGNKADAIQQGQQQP